MSRVSVCVGEGVSPTEVWLWRSILSALVKKQEPKRLERHKRRWGFAKGWKGRERFDWEWGREEATEKLGIGLTLFQQGKGTQGILVCVMQGGTC